MQKVAEKLDARGGEARDERVEASQGVARRAARDAYTERAERCRLAEVRVRHEERAAARPVGGALDAQLDRLACDGGGRAHPAARSSATCMRLIRSASISLDTLFRVRSTSSGKASGVNRFGDMTTTRPVDSRCSVAPSLLRSSWRSSTSRCAWASSRLSGS